MSEAKPPTTGNETTPANVVPSEQLPTLNVIVEAVIGKQRFTLAEISTWRIGQVLEFTNLIHQPIELHAAGKHIASGTLCQVDGRVGVQITEIR